MTYPGPRVDNGILGNGWLTIADGMERQNVFLYLFSSTINSITVEGFFQISRDILPLCLNPIPLYKLKNQ